jgi:glycine/D-amino acid oxidase-like deaminating enzyme/nitrite reductase/ring-hydroxylating ferredoxin subunit
MGGRLTPPRSSTRDPGRFPATGCGQHAGMPLPLPPVSRSLWLDEIDQPTYPPYGGDDRRYDVAVVGGGITGLTAAAVLKRAGLSVVVLERRRIGAVTSGNTTAKVTVLHGLRYARIARAHGADAAAAYAAANLAALTWVATQAEGVDCQFERAPALTYTVDPARRAALEEEVRALTAAGVPARLVTETDLPFPVAAAVRVEDQGQFDPVPYLDALAREVDGAGSAVHEGTRVTGVRGGEPGTVATSAGELRARHVVLATGIPFPDRGLFFARVEPHRSYALAVRAPQPHPDGMFLGVDAPTRSVRRARVGAEEVLVVGGNGHKVGHGHPLLWREQDLADWAATHLGATEVTHRWSAQDYAPVDGLPYVGRLWPFAEHVFVATGFDKWGMTNGTAAALMLTDLVLGRRNPWVGTLSSTRLAPRASALPAARANADVAARLARDWLTPASPAGEDPPEGQGRVWRRGVVKTGTATVDGVVTTVSATCTHLGGVVTWNDAECTWDCPLHGSRFSADGSLLEGPATTALPVHDRHPVGGPPAATP